MSKAISRLLATLALCPICALASPDETRLLQLGQQVCKQPDAPISFQGATAQRSAIEFRNTSIGERLEWRPAPDQVQIELLQLPGRPSQTILTRTIPAGASLRLALDQNCELSEARRIAYDDDGMATRIEHLDRELQKLDRFDWLNPPLPAPAANEPQGPRIGMIDSGVNYLLPHIAASLARHDDGSLIGFDFWDMDDLPFDANPARSAFQVQRHGSRTASVLLREAPGIALVPYRYPRPDMSRMKQLVEHAASNDVRIVGMPLGSNRYADWADFARAAEAHPEILFIASAGNNGRDIDLSPVYPAGLEIDNLLVTTSSNDFVEPAERTNYGRIAVDYLLPAESLDTIDFDGSAAVVSGSSYAVPRLAALAARLLAAEPDLTTKQLKKRLAGFSVRGRTGRYVATGFIPDPLADTAMIEQSDQYPFIPESPAPRYELSLAATVLDEQWLDNEVEATLGDALDILSQCDIGIRQIEVTRYDTSDWLRDLATGSAHTLLTRTRGNENTLAVVFAKDTRMNEAYDAEAFGLGNTANRPWLRHSVWLTHATTDRDIALAHELFHVLANSGDHNEISGNLMQRRTARGETNLGKAQCQTAIDSGLELQLLIER